MFYSIPHLSLRAKRPSLGFWRALTFSFLISLLLSACGGGISIENSADPTTNLPNPITPPVFNQSTSRAINPGVYTALCGLVCGNQKNEEITTIVMRVPSSTDETAQVFVLHFNSPDPEIYAGTATSTGAGTASIGNLTYFQNISGTPRTGTASLSVSAAGLLQTEVRFAAKEATRNFTWSAILDNTLKLDAPATASQLAGSWTGRFTYPFGSDEMFSLTFTAAPTPTEPNKLTTTSSKLFQECEMILGEATPALGGVKLFYVSFKVPPRGTQCSLLNQTLTGVAYVTSSPVAGKTKRLQWLAIAPDGRGVSFRADR